MASPRVRSTPTTISLNGALDGSDSKLSFSTGDRAVSRSVQSSKAIGRLAER
jgi:hypothetical protein